MTDRPAPEPLTGENLAWLRAMLVDPSRRSRLARADLVQLLMGLLATLDAARTPSQPDLDGRAVHAAWRDGMLAQGRAVAPERMAWETLTQQDRDLDDGIAAALASQPAPADPEPDSTLTFVARGNPPRPVLVGITPHPARARQPAPAAVREPEGLNVERLATILWAIESARFSGAYPHLGDKSDCRRLAETIIAAYVAQPDTAGDETP